MMTRSLKKQAGLSFIEVMVGFVIGAMIMLAAYNSASLFQAASRTSTSGNNALIDGIMGLRAIEYDIKNAGFGFIANQGITCTRLNAVVSGNQIANNTAIYPVFAQRNGNTPDVLTIIYGNSPMAATPTNIIGSSNNSVTVNYMSNNLQAGSFALLATQGANLPCTLVSVTSVTQNGLNTVVNYNANGATVSLDTANSLLINVGNLIWQQWSIQNNSLVMTNNITGVNTVIADNIVQMRVQYGVNDGVSPNIQSWVEPTGIWAAPDLQTMERIRAVRIAIVARSAKRERPSNGATACNATTTFPVPWAGATPLDLSADPNWQCYRYRVLQTVVPLKNIIINGVI